MQHIKAFHTILFVADQQVSSRFYQRIFRKTPDLDVPGMTEFKLSGQCKIGLMPAKGITRILGDHIPDPSSGAGIPRAELYFYVDDIQLEFDNALKAGAKPLSPVADRNWGDKVCYFSDPDGHVLAFAQKNE